MIDRDVMKIMHELLSNEDIITYTAVIDKYPMLRNRSIEEESISLPTNSLAHTLYRVVQRLIGLK